MLRQGFTVGRREDYEEALAFAVDEGFDFLELNTEHGFERRTVDPERVGALADDHGVALVAHLPYRLDPGSPHEHVREGAARELEAALDAAAAMGAEKGVFHAVSNAPPDAWDHDDVRAWRYETVRRVVDHADDLGIVPCVENLTSPFFDAGDFPDLFERTDADACLDTGHAHVTGQDGADRREGPSNGERGGTTREQAGASQAALIREHGDRVAHVHLNETRTDEDDEHLPVGMGFVDFGAIATAMVETDWTGTLTHELWPARPAYVAASKRRFDSLLGDATGN